MDTRRLIIFIILSFGFMLIWDKIFPPHAVVTQTITSSTASSTTVENTTDIQLHSGKMINLSTNLLSANIDTNGGDIRTLQLLKYNDTDNSPYSLLTNTNEHVFIAQTGLIAKNQQTMPNHNTTFNIASLKHFNATTKNESYSVLQLNHDLDNIHIIKTYTVTDNSYLIKLGYTIVNDSAHDLTDISAYWRFLRDEKAPTGETKFVKTFTGPVYFSTQDGFNALKFSSLTDENQFSITDGWVGFSEHYFNALFLLNAYNYPAVCTNNVICHVNMKTAGKNKQLASAGLITDFPTIKTHSSYSISIPIYVGPQAYYTMQHAAPELERTKDYGWVYVFATPLFWLLINIFALVNNWGVAIILLTLSVKALLYPLTNTSYRSMAKMKLLAPKIELLKRQYQDDKIQLQKAILTMYKTEKINPISGCLPMLLQVPVFIGLYWALLCCVELRQAHFLWITDLSRQDPYFILPILLAITMFLQTFLNPPVADPIQAKMMKIMPVAFSVIFFFFPAGLVIYWLANNILSMAQQWQVRPK